MKKESIAAIILAILALGCIWNLQHLKKTVVQASTHITQSAQACLQEDFTLALTELDEAFAIWINNEGYASTFLPQGDVDSVTDAYFSAYSAIRCFDRLEAATAYEALLYQLQSILSAESIRLQSIF